MDGFVDRLHALRFLRACDPSYGALTFTLVGLPPTGYISLLLDILFGSFLPSLWSSNNQSLLGSREPTSLCNHVESLIGTCPVSAVNRDLSQTCGRKAVISVRVGGPSLAFGSRLAASLPVASLLPFPPV